jgi:predicted ATP-dependent protease
MPAAMTTGPWSASPLAATTGKRMPTDTQALKLRPEQLRATFRLDHEEVEALSGVAGQGRAREAITFGLAMRAPGYNIAVSGPEASGRSRLIRELVSELAAAEPPVPDWVYLHNFADPRRPVLVSLPAATGDDLQRALAQVADACRTSLPAAFASESYEARTRQVLEPIGEKRGAVFETLQETANAEGFVVNMTPMGLLAAPLGADGQPMSPQAFAALSDSEREPIEERGGRVQEAIAQALRQLRQLDAETHQRIDEIDREAIRSLVGPILDEVKRDFADYGLATHLDAIEKDIAAHIDAYKRFAGGLDDKVPPQVLQQLNEEREALLQRYTVNLFVTHGADVTGGSPVVEEKHPSFFNLFGRVEFENRAGTLVTDFTHIRPGALHLANGGYLVLEVQEMLSDIRSWPRLKRALKTQEIRYEDPSEGLPFPVVNLSPDSMPLDLKLILVGPPLLFSLLEAFDSDFSELFKIRADFEPDTSADEATVTTYLAFARQTQRECELRPFGPGAFEEVLSFGTRLSGRQDRLSTRLGLVSDLCREADHFAATAGADAVTGEHFRQAIAARESRSGLIPDRIRRMIAEGTLHVETSGAVAGQVNGLAVFSTGSHAFGLPTRITCRTGAGRRGVVAIERETERSGAIHTKGVLVLDGYLSGTFGHREPLAFNASLTFEQSYDEVEGDSASSAELYAILTSLAEVPVRQDIAVTGSVDQFGNIQAVGGVTEKVEGFFDVCREVGLSGSQGVIIPATNVVNLTLRPDVVEAVRDGTFHLWAIRRIEEGLEILTGTVADQRGLDGRYAAPTIFGRVALALASMRETAGDAHASG